MARISRNGALEELNERPRSKLSRFWLGFGIGVVTTPLVVFVAYAIVMPDLLRAIESQHETDCRQQCPGCDVYLPSHGFRPRAR
jgi:hypothetical protein